MNRRVAAIDIGTNTVLLVIAEESATGVRPVLERATITRLGEGVDKTGTLSAAAMQRTLACLEGYATLIQTANVQALAVVGTSAMRDAKRSHEFVSDVERLLGVAPSVIAGQREAELTFRGAISGLTVSGPVVVFDVGGGSTEIISAEVVDGSALIADSVSLDIGSVRLFERHLHLDPPSPEQLEQVRAQVREALRGAPSVPRWATLVGVAGTVTTLAAVDQQLATYDSELVHGSVLPAERIEELLGQLGAQPLAQRLAMPGLEPGRADVIVSGAAIVAEVVRWSGCPGLVVSDRGVRWGLIHELLDSSAPAL